MKILLFGKDGQIGSYLQKSLASLGEVSALNRQDCDLTDFAQVKKSITAYKPDIIVNAAAYTNVDKAESEKELAQKINAEAVEVMAISAKAMGCLLMHYSTDYIFDGTKETAYIETDKTNPLSFYGLTKLKAEEKIRDSGCDHLILRTTWVYSNGGKNFVNTIINLAKEKDTLPVINDQIGAPTSASFIAESTAFCIKHGINKDNMGTYHLTASGSTSWHEFAKYILTYLQNNGIILQLKPENITPITSEEYKMTRPSSAIRPQNSVLNNQLVGQKFNLPISSWEIQLQQVLSEGIKENKYKNYA